MSKILVIADQKDHDQVAIPQALRLAKAFKADLHVVFFCHETLREFGDEADNIKQSILTHYREYAENCLSEYAAEEVPTEYEVVWKKQLHLWVNEYARNHQLLMVVKTGHRSETLTYTPTDWHLLRECPAPVLIASESRWHKSGTVMAAVDLESPLEEKQLLNTRVLDYAGTLASRLGYELHLCYVPQLPGLLSDLGLKFSDEETLKAKDRLQGSIQQLVTTLGVPEKQIHIKAGEPQKVIPSIATRNKAAIVVMGTIGRSGIKGKLMGNTAEKVLSLLRTDVITIKPEY